MERVGNVFGGFQTIPCGFDANISKQNMSESSVATNSNDETKTENKTPIDTVLVHWEEFALCIEEHFHAREMFNRKPHGKPMGHR